MEKIPVNAQQRDLLLMPFPYSDLSGSKVRPVLVVSNNKFNNSSGDLIVCGVTSNISKDFYTVLLEKNGLETGKLFEDCCIKVKNIAKIDKLKIIKKIGKVGEQDFSQVLLKLDAIFHP